MNPTVISMFVFACTFAGVLAGMRLSAALPDHHLSSESKETVKLGIGLIATMTALVLGLVTASAKGSFDALNKEVKQSAVDVLKLDWTLARYGPESKETREALYHALEKRLELTWPQKPSRAPAPNVQVIPPGAEGFVERIRGLSPRNEDQRLLRSHALDLSEALLEARWVVVSSLGTSVPVPFLVVLVFWLTIIFMSFGLSAPRNATTLVALFVCALSVAGAIFLILEMDGPFEGLIRISPDALRYACSQINQ
jgi:hypothetical protein